MIEMVWVLERAYRLAEHETAAAIERVLQADVLVVENNEEEP
jgi:predicted nucleic-acid-binding protein